MKTETANTPLTGPDRAAADPNPETVATATRRRFSGKYKLRILSEAEKAAPGEIGALLRREGLYSSHLSKWREQRDAGALAGLTPKKRGRKAHPIDPQARRIAQLEKENEHLQRRLEQAETIIEVQKKLSQLLAMTEGP